MTIKEIFSFSHFLLGLTILLIAAFFIYYWNRQRARLGTTEWIDRIVKREKFNFTFTLHRFTKFDYIPLAVIVLVFGFISFWKLGDMKAPVTFHNFVHKDDFVIVKLEKESYIDGIWYYTGLNNGSANGEYRLEYSLDGEEFLPVSYTSGEEQIAVILKQEYSNLFSWLKVDRIDGFTASYIKVISTGYDKTELGELALFSYGNLVRAINHENIFDEQDMVPDEPTYMNSMYFDEIYHGRAAYEIVRNRFPYEWVHPPLGKVLISIGVQLFGMTPFGWRCVGTLFGIFIIAAIYVLLKSMFGKPWVVICGTLLIAFDFMRFTQSRISTVDQYPTFFIIMAYLFMYRFLCMKHTKRVRDTIRPLFFSGLFWGLGAASKWTVIYAGVGLALLFFTKLVFDIKAHITEGSMNIAVRPVLICIAAFGFFIIMPAVIYILAYISYGYGSAWIDNATYAGMPWRTDEGLDMTIGNGMLWNPRYYQRILKIQKGMYEYHAKLPAFKEVVKDGVTVMEKMHPYQSTWYEWIFDIRPILYYWRTDFLDNTKRCVITAFTNPVVTWAGLAGIVGLFVETIRKRDPKAVFIIIGFLSQIVPWMLITRCVFAYHYFPSLVFLVIAVAYYFNSLLEREPKYGKIAVVGLTALTGIVFIMFYPVLSGAPVSSNYANTVLKWIGSWPV